jgi:DNA-directed RNA polymerase subunit RPC12/RpoP
MKAITCPQCGAIIKRISLKDESVACDYCGAEILLEEHREKIVEIPDHGHVWKPAEMDRTDYSGGTNYKPLIAFVVIGASIFLTIVFIIAGKKAVGDQSNSTKKSFAATTSPYSPPPFPTVKPTVYPKITYEVEVKWIGDDDMEHYEVPSIDETKLPSGDGKELKKTVFKNRRAEVKITIDENGDVTEAKAVSGHPILKEAAENAARKTLFANRRKPTTRLLTYIFRLTSE